jgi:hypothetical protein
VHNESHVLDYPTNCCRAKALKVEEPTHPCRLQAIIASSETRARSRYAHHSHLSPNLLSVVSILLLSKASHHSIRLLKLVPHTTTHYFYRTTSLTGISILLIMGFKRKRSSYDLSPLSDSSCSSIRAPEDVPCSPTPLGTSRWHDFEEDSPMGGLEFGSTTMSTTIPDNGSSDFYVGDSHLHSRTRKRFRDNRPDETSIHGMSGGSIAMNLFNTCQNLPFPNSSSPSVLHTSPQHQ